MTFKVGNIGGREFAESLAPDVQKLLVSEYTSEDIMLNDLINVSESSYFLRSLAVADR